MLKVFLIDDEKLILNGLQYIIDWEGAGFQLSGCFTQARMAMDAARAEKPDIIVTDIRMPGCSGLDMIASLKKELPDTLFVVLSAYDSFEYAQQALTLGAFRYLLKPIEKKALLEVLIEARATILGRRMEIKSESDRQDRLMRSLLIREWLFNGIQPNIQEGNDAFFIPGFSRNFRLLFCYVPIQMTEDFHYETIHLLVRQRVYDCLKSIYQPIDLFMHAVFYVAILDAGEQEQIPPPQILQEHIFQKIKQKPLIYQTNNAASLSNGYTFFQEEFARFRNDVFFEQAISKPKSGPDHDRLGSIQKDLLQALNQSDHESIEKIVKTLFVMCSSIADREKVLSLYQSLRQFVCRYSSEIDPAHEPVLPLLPLDDFLTHRDLLQYITRFVLKEASAISRQFASNKASLVVRAKLYIDAHYDDPNLKLTSVAQQLFVNYSYLSHLFNTETGYSFNHYLTTVRLEKAKKLLVNSPLSILEIAGRVGYADAKNFFRVFKKQYSQSPQRYRQEKTSSSAELRKSCE